MREVFRNYLLDAMSINDDIYLLLGGVGYGFYTPGERILNCEASEQAMIDIAAGMALEDKIPFVYCITPHLYRAFEGIRIYLDHFKIPVHLVGIGRDLDYDKLGFTHTAEDAKDVFSVFKNIKQYWPETKEEIPEMIDQMILEKIPSFISLRR